MYICDLKRNKYLYLVLRPSTKYLYKVDECFLSFYNAVTYLKMYGNMNCLLIIVKIKEVVK